MPPKQKENKMVRTRKLKEYNEDNKYTNSYVEITWTQMDAMEHDEGMEKVNYYRSKGYAVDTDTSIETLRVMTLMYCPE